MNRKGDKDKEQQWIESIYWGRIDEKDLMESFVAKLVGDMIRCL